MIPLSDSEASILIVEENEYHGLLMERQIAQRLDHSRVVLARCADEALRIARSQPFDIAIVDFVLSECDGLALLRSLNQIDPKLTIVVVAEDLTEASTREVFRCGCKEILIKDHSFYSVVPRMIAGLYHRKKMIGARERRDARLHVESFQFLHRELTVPLDNILAAAEAILGRTKLLDNDLTERVRSIHQSALSIKSSLSGTVGPEQAGNRSGSSKVEEKRQYAVK
jgi:DNA-binding NarL/FixJ family response regulator